jgi:hypothetical protein
VSASGGVGAGKSATAGGSGGGVTARITGILTREDAVLLAVSIAELLEIVRQFEDAKLKSNSLIAAEFVDSNAGSYLDMIELVYASIQLILNSSFSLSTRRTITLDRDRQVVELCAELYGSLDNLDAFVIENKLNIDELALLPMGREVTYYV